MKLWKQNPLVQIATGAGLIAVTTSANAAVDVSAVTDALADAGPAIGTVAGAVLAVLALVVTFKLIRRAM